MPRKPRTTPAAGHNSLDKTKLKELVQRIEALLDDKDDILEAIKEVFLEAKGQGFDQKALREVIRLRKQNREERSDLQHVIDEYMSALGDYSTTELGRSALERAGLAPPV